MPLELQLKSLLKMLYPGILNSLRFALHLLFTARRNARIVLAIAIPSVRPSMRLSVTRRYCVKTTAHSTVQFGQSDSKMCHVLEKNIPHGRSLPPKILAPSDLPIPEGSEF